MKKKLIKTVDGYELFTQGFLKGSTNHELIDTLNIEEGNIRYKLSLKNCQTIERGYDLDDKISEHLEKNHIEASTKRVQVIKELILEILGDKKFSEEDLMEAYSRGQTNSPIQSLQQTEWDVEIEMTKEEYTWTPPGEGFEDQRYRDWREVRKLDADGCLILKRI